ncbi:hypothetical protein FEM03_23350 [Phragmitibacter flavus]|uniref:DUF1080 domain-containing protein n=1 Tax=Phragmitibacter flavus TaxID=2576071 RepID=A0A5R8K7L9_9BACT|nr:hypothetical protein [Phragmitibacter flavus]TLD68340.1 hypothetical protein FEM03_23350 [Phragmitibacter flavus]
MLILLLISGCREARVTEWRLFDEEWRGIWVDAAFEGNGGMEAMEDGFVLKEGRPMTGMVLKAWLEKGLPVVDYSIEYEAMRVGGTDFFGTVTFPVGSAEQCVSFVLGGWGGGQMGISSVDGQDAAGNETGSSRVFENGVWYPVKIVVRAGLLQVWVDRAPVVHLMTRDRILGLRAGMEVCAPFGFATYGTEGRIRNVVVKVLPVEGW